MIIRKSVIFFSLFTFPLFASEFEAVNNGKTNSSSVVCKQMENMWEFFLNKQYEEYLRYMHPKLVEYMGGKEKFLSFLSRELDDTGGFKIIEIKILKNEISKIHVEDNTYQVIIPFIMKMENKKEKMGVISKSYCIGISFDKGDKWIFLDGTGKKNNIFFELFPEVSKKLNFPDLPKNKTYKLE